MPGLTFLQRTHSCGDLRAKDADRTVILNGWVQRRRNLGGLLFIDLRDRWGITQIVFNPQDDKELFDKAETLKNEYVIAVKGLVNHRPEGTVNSSLPTGEIEISVQEIQILNTSKTPPFVVSDDLNIEESHRLKYRYVDLRRPKMLKNFTIRHKFLKAARDFLDDQHFLEVETPILVRSTPEGARDYLVPSRVHPGKFFALPQSPQLFKQLLMVSGFEKYFQIAKCFRDEDLRADRQPEFTQIDLEMSFVKQDDVLTVVEELIAYCFREVVKMEIPTPFERITWFDAYDQYGTDKPDRRFGMKLVDVTEVIGHTTFNVFNSVIDSGGRLKGIRIPGCADWSRKQTDELTEYAKKFGAKGILTIALKEGGKFKSPLDKHLDDEKKKALIEAFGAEEGDLIAIAAGERMFANRVLGRLRLKLGNDLGLIDKSKFDFHWVIDFPMFAYNEEEDRLEAEHHMFTSPHPEDIDLIKSDPLKVRANAYDMVFNGNEGASGSIRIHDRKMQQLIFDTVGIDPREAQDRFGFLLDAFEYGAPPHGGVALGADRLIAEICGEESIRDVMIFPKNNNCYCPLTDAPVGVDQDQLEILSLEVKAAEEEAKEKHFTKGVVPSTKKHHAQ